MLIMGLAGSVDVETLKAQFHRKLGISCGLGCQFLLMPLIGFILISIFEPEEHVGLTLLILVSSSGGAYSNWWCSLFNADLALSVAMTAVSTFASAFMLPINLTMYLKLLNKGKTEAEIDVPWAALFQGIGTVMVAILVGVFISTRCPRLQKGMTAVGNVSGICMILLTLFVAVFPKKPCSADLEGVTPLWGKPPGFYGSVAAPFFASLATSMALSSLSCLKLTRPERVTITIEVSYQNVGIASAVALTAFCEDPRKQSDAAAVPLIYGLVEAIAMFFFVVWAWKAGWTYAEADAPACEVIRADLQPKRASQLASMPPSAEDKSPQAPSTPPSFVLVAGAGDAEVLKDADDSTHGEQKSGRYPQESHGSDVLGQVSIADSEIDFSV